MARIRTEYEALIHHELRTVRQRGLLSAAPAADTSSPTGYDWPAIDWLKFADKFRGSPEYVQSSQRQYVERFREAPGEVLDIGCGRGEFLGLLRDAGIPARGVDLNHEMAERSRAHGFAVEETDALSFLAAAPPESLGGLIASQVVEHLEPDYLLRMLAAAQAALRPGATLVLETINPACWSAFFESYIRDLTHVRPVHPDTLKFLVMAAGFADVRIQGRSPYPPEGRLQPVPPAARGAAAAEPPLAAVIDTVDAHAARLNGLFFTDRDYAVIARRP